VVTILVTSKLFNIKVKLFKTIKHLTRISYNCEQFLFLFCEQYYNTIINVGFKLSVDYINV
jgi:hypothetical protein